MDSNTLTILASAFLPLLVDLVLRVVKSDSSTVAKVVAGVLAFGVALVSELSVKPAVDFSDLLGRFAVVFALSQVVYRNIYKDTELSKVLVGK